MNDSPGMTASWVTPATPSSPFGTVDATSVRLRLTRYGDADLSGFVNLNDFNRLATNFGLSSAATAARFSSELVRAREVPLT